MYDALSPPKILIIFSSLHYNGIIDLFYAEINSPQDLIPHTKTEDTVKPTKNTSLLSVTMVSLAPHPFILEIASGNELWHKQTKK